MKPGEWRLVDTEETTEPIPGRPSFVERRVVKTYRAPFRTGATISFGCVCNGMVDLVLADGETFECECGRTYRIDLGIVRVDAETVPPAGL